MVDISLFLPDNTQKIFLTATNQLPFLPCHCIPKIFIVQGETAQPLTKIMFYNSQTMYDLNIPQLLGSILVCFNQVHSLGLLNEFKTCINENFHICLKHLLFNCYHLLQIRKDFVKGCEIAKVTMLQYSQPLNIGTCATVKMYFHHH